MTFIANGSGNGGYFFELGGGNPNCGFSDGNNVFEHTDNDSLSIGTWYHLTCVFDNAGNVMKIYINGEESLSEAEASAPDADTPGLHIGSNPGPGNFTDSTIDDVRVYNRALSPAEVKQLYQLGSVRITQ